MLIPAAICLLFALGQTVLCVTVTNTVIMRLHGSVFKDLLTLLFGALCVPVTMAALILGWPTPAVQGFVHLQPATAGAWALILLLVGELALIGWVSVRTFRHRRERMRTVGLNSLRVRPLVGPGAIGLPGLRFNTNALHLTEVDLTPPRLPAGLDGLRVLHMSDLHVEMGQVPSMRAVDLASELEPDIVLLTGDYIVVQATEDLDAIFARLAALDCPLGVWCSQGNHDIWHDDGSVPRALERHGLPLLANRAVECERGGEAVRLIGIEHPWNPVQGWSGLLGERNGTFRIALSHTPDNFPRLAEAGIDLILAGHTHGGQWRFPLVGPVIVPCNQGRRFDQGLFRQADSMLWVTRGVGCVGFRARINCPPEITLFTLRSPEAAEAAEAKIRAANAA